MDFQNLIKKILVLILLLVIIAGGVFLWQKYQNEGKYVDRIKTILSEKVDSLKAMIVPELQLPEDSELDLSEVNISAFVPDEASADKENLSREEEEEKEQEVIVVPKPQLTLAEIQERVEEVSEEVERIKREVKRLSVLAEMQKEIDAIVERAETISQRIGGLAESEGGVEIFARESDFLNQENVDPV